MSPEDLPGTPTEVARAECSRGEVVLRRRPVAHGADVLELRVNGVFVMDTAETSTEVQLARASLAQVARPARVVVGGLGLGFTLQEVLADPRVESVRVVEVEEAVVGWMRDGTIPHGPGVLADRRVTVVVADVLAAVAEAHRQHDLVLLDVDNGPDHLVHEGNAAVYDVDFLVAVRRLLRPGGAVTIWSAAPAPRLLQALRTAFGETAPADGSSSGERGRVEELTLEVTLQGRPTAYYLYLAHLPASPGVT